MELEWTKERLTPWVWLLGLVHRETVHSALIESARGRETLEEGLGQVDGVCLAATALVDDSHGDTLVAGLLVADVDELSEWSNQESG